MTMSRPRACAAALRADEVGARALRPDLELLLRRGAERVGSRDDDRVPVLGELRRQLADRRRLAGAVDADDEDHTRPCRDVECARIAEQLCDLLRERLAEVAERAARLEPAHELGGRAHADVGLDQRLLEPLPRELVARVEGGRGDLLGERAARLRERVAEAREEPRPFRLRLGGGVGLPQ